MATPVQAWHDEHMEFEALLNELQRQVDIFHRGDRPDYERMLQVLSTLRERGDRSHHPREDVAFARLAKRCPDLALELARLQQEHRVIAQAGEKLHGLLSAALDEAVLQRAEVEIAAAMYLVYYGNHIAHEEEAILGRAASALTAEDWEAVRKAAG
jgi:hemerythrin-like domain-containing protein